jgi:hypothetical protein
VEVAPKRFKSGMAQCVPARHRHTLPVDHGGDVVGVRAPHLEGDDGAFALAWPMIRRVFMAPSCSWA